VVLKFPTNHPIIVPVAILYSFILCGISLKVAVSVVRVSRQSVRSVVGKEPCNDMIQVKEILHVHSMHQEQQHFLHYSRKPPQARSRNGGSAQRSSLEETGLTLVRMDN